MCSVHQGIFSTSGVFSALGDTLSTSGNVQYIGDTMSILGDIMSRLGDVQYIGVASRYPLRY